jgi:hypothetical protein
MTDRKENESFSDWYIRHQSFWKRLKIRFNYFIMEIRVLKTHIGYKLKYGWSYDGNPCEKGESEIEN